MSTLATLGPHGSDSEHAAKLLLGELGLDGRVVLCPSFEAALAHARDHGGLALVPAAYQQKDAGGVTFNSWADLHFRIENEGSLELWLAKVLPLKEMAVAKRAGVEVPRSAAIHAATAYYAQTFLRGVQLSYCESKPEAVRRCAAGEVDACIGSLEVIQGWPALVVLHRFVARMCWTVYRQSHKPATLKALDFAGAAR